MKDVCRKNDGEEFGAKGRDVQAFALVLMHE